MDFSANYQNLYKTIFALYHLPENKAKLLFHGWHHIQFVHNKAIEFAKELNCDVEQTAVAALVHDLNYIFSEKLEPEAARSITVKYLTEAGYSADYANQVADLIEDEHIAYRGARELSDVAKALADADSLFKALPTTPIVFASKFITQNKFDIEKLAHKVVDEQRPLLEAGTYFYTKSAQEKYLNWASLQVELWENVLVALQDSDVKELLATASELGVI